MIYNMYLMIKRVDKKRIERLGKNPSSRVFCETIETWEKEMMAKYRKSEQTAQSCMLDWRVLESLKRVLRVF